jgi:hypothetical protein
VHPSADTAALIKGAVYAVRQKPPRYRFMFRYMNNILRLTIVHRVSGRVLELKADTWT